jgi:hypothetical protein
MIGCMKYTLERKASAAQVLTNLPIVVSLATRAEDVAHRFYLANFFSSPDLFDCMYARNCCGIVI